MTNKYILESVVIAIVLTFLSYGVGIWMGWIIDLNWLEVFAVATSYSCTWLCTRQSRSNYVIGVVTTAAYSVLFYNMGAPALALFNLYLVFSLAYGWFYWRSDDITRPVTSIKLPGYVGYSAVGVALAGAFVLANLIWNPVGILGLSYIDVSLAAASGVAQLMLDRKKLQTWIVWAMINIVSIPYFISIGLPLVAFQYVFFLVNTAIGFVAWKQTMAPATEQ